MSSQEQIDANRRNGGLSNGPKTLEGKAASAKNAIKHGLLSDEALLPFEDKDKFEQFADKLRSELWPQGELELALVERIVGLLWRLHRIGKLEAGILYWQRLKIQVGIVSWQATESLEGVPGWPKTLNAFHKPGEKIKELAKRAGAEDLAAAGEAFVRGQESLGKLSRYEGAIQRNLIRLLHELQRLQAVRKGERVPTPQAIDIDVTGVRELRGTGDERD